MDKTQKIPEMLRPPTEEEEAMAMMEASLQRAFVETLSNPVIRTLSLLKVLMPSEHEAYAYEMKKAGVRDDGEIYDFLQEKFNTTPRGKENYYECWRNLYVAIQRAGFKAADDSILAMPESKGH